MVGYALALDEKIMAAKNKIQARTLKGFRDFLPELMMPREGIIDTAKSVYRSFGFAPIDTPVLEYTEILLGKGSEETDKVMYRFEDNGGRDVTMRFDLTIPLARFVAQHSSELGMPFKRYHVGPVWRGENTGRGRYREFVQCDFDTIGTTGLVSDIETGLVIQELFDRLGMPGIQLRINNRKVLSGLLERLSLLDRAVPILRALDKLDKIGPDKVVAEMVAQAGATETQAREVLVMTEIDGSNTERIDKLAPLVAGSELGAAGVEELAGVVGGLADAGVPHERVVLDLSIARGLDYYTGTIYETSLVELPSIGSVCSGGRYDDLASMFTKEHLPGIGASLGVDRLLAAMEELGRIEKRSTPARTMIAFFDKEHRSDYLALAMKLRRAGIDIELYPDPKKLGTQIKYAVRRGFERVLIIGGDEWVRGVAQVKDLASGESQEVALDELATLLA
ncbi:MAG: histidyl-tRNA synthetase [Planctomycetota bacterium]|jgi:histidyl-tRNA synthetase